MTQRMRLATVALVLMSAVAACTAPPPPPPPPPGDTLPPVLTGPGDLRLDTARTDGAVVTYLVEAFDVGDGAAAPVDCSPSSGELFPVGATIVSCTAADAAGNVGELSFTVTIELLPGAVSVVAGSTHACALLDDGTVRCWGLNNQWQLGTADAPGNAATPVPVPGVQDAVALTAGSSHTCALVEGGTVTCWGVDGGRLGHGVIAAFALPAPVAGLTDAVAVSAGDFHTCALLGDGTARCWGANDKGQLGNGTTTTSGTPVAVSGLTGALSISAGGDHSCAVRASGLSRTVRCWGANDQGQLGNGTTTGSSVPVTVPGLTTTFVGAAAVAAGTVSTCALLDNGTARCWGSNEYGQLGDGSFTNSSSPVEVSGLTAATSLDLRFINACAAMASGEIRCWGNNQLGQLGNGTTSSSQVPVPVSGISGASDVSVGSLFACATLASREVTCWGDNDFGRLGDGTGLDSSIPVGVVGIP